MNQMNQMNSQIIKSANDTRAYKHLVLQNGLKCLIVSDPTNEKAAAALSVDAGGYDAPTDLPGLSHLLEHMLFFGSETYPEENYYTEYITQNGGDTNAFTSETATTYYFDICSKQFEHALDVFAHFFIDPIFNGEMIEREVNAVDSEFYGTFNNDSQRQYQVMNDLMDRDYPVTKFICGNKKTLCGSGSAQSSGSQEELYQRMMNFYNEHYSSDKMYLVVVSCDTIETLEQMVTGKFSSVRYNDNCTKRKINPEVLPYDKFLIRIVQLNEPMDCSVDNHNDGSIGDDRLSNDPALMTITTSTYPYIKVEGLKSKHRLTIIWQLPSMLLTGCGDNINQSIMINSIKSFWSNILGHEGEKSLYSYLKGKSLITTLGAGMDGNNDGNKMFDLFKISIGLTEYGNDNVLTIVRTINHTIKQLQDISSKSIERLYNEEKKISWMNFNNKSKESPDSYALGLLDNLRLYDESMVLAGDYYYPEYNAMIETEIRKFISTVNNTVPIIMHASPLYKNLNEMTEIHYGTKYQIESTKIDLEITLNCMDEKEVEIDIPGPNVFIPESFTLIDTKLSGLKQSIQSDLGEMWWLPCTVFEQPKLIASVMLILGSLHANILKNTTLCKLYTSILRDTINEKLYPATLTGISYSIYYTDGGIKIELYGYSDKLINVWITIMGTISNFKCDPERFNQMIEKEKKSYESINQSNTREQLSHHINEKYSIDENYHMDCLEYLNSISIIDIFEFEQTLYRSCNYIGAIQGNGTKEMCEKYTEYLHLMLMGKNASKLPSYRSMVHEPADRDYADNVFNYEPYNEKEIEVNSSTATIYNLGTNHMSNDSNILLNQILMTILSDSFFDKLRTKQQLGYYVGCNTSKYSFLDENHSAIAFKIQSSEYDSDYLQSKISEYVNTIDENLTESGFKNCVDSTVALLSQPFQTLGESASYHWRKIIDRSFDFLTRERRIEIVKKIQYADLLQYAKDNISNNHKKLIINVN